MHPLLIHLSRQKFLITQMMLMKLMVLNKTMRLIPPKQSNEADRAQEGMAGHQNVSIKGAQGVQLPEESVPASIKRSLMERHPNTSIFEVINSLRFYSHFEGYI
jgi:hypothetical protein